MAGYGIDLKAESYILGVLSLCVRRLSLILLLSVLLMFWRLS